MTDSTGSIELENKRHFLTVFRRWESLFKRADRGDLQADKWLVVEYYNSLGHLSPAGFEELTKLLKEKCTFFPSIAECLAVIKCDRYDYGHPFRGRPAALFHQRAAPQMPAPPRQIEDNRDGPGRGHVEPRHMPAAQADRQARWTPTREEIEALKAEFASKAGMER